MQHCRRLQLLVVDRFVDFCWIHPVMKALQVFHVGKVFINELITPWHSTNVRSNITKCCVRLSHQSSFEEIIKQAKALSLETWDQQKAQRHPISLKWTTKQQSWKFSLQNPPPTADVTSNLLILHEDAWISRLALLWNLILIGKMLNNSSDFLSNKYLQKCFT